MKPLQSSGEVKIVKDLDTVSKVWDLIVEDIIDTGQNLKYIVDLLHYRKANSVKVCTLLIRKSDVNNMLDYGGLDIPMNS